VLVGLVCAAALALLLWPERVSRKGYDRIKASMTPEEVLVILGRPAADDSELEGLTDEDFDASGAARESWERLPGEMSSIFIWQSRRGLLAVWFSRDRGVSKEWAPRPTLYQRLQRQWRRWFP
jgi:hypothetical protein